MSKMEIRLAGTGGQGLITGTIILAEAGIFENKFVAQSQSYGPEARGGMCKGEVIISDNKIGFTKVTRPTFVMALSQLSFKEYCHGLDEDCYVLVDESIEVPADYSHKKFMKLPILQTAREVVGKMQTVNIVSIGAINKILGFSSAENMEKAVLMHVPKGTEELNLKALAEGAKLVK
ncbi:MAG: 2-oxoacid:acceptor oxidoreductase family protein [Clostridia bacterium]|nr:2-oxoacid:acceptor oxidoreductase family protein [Clostridia bacterium]